MSTAVQMVPVVEERRYGGVGRCKCSFWFAVAHDILGVFIMMVGVFGGLVIHDLFIYAGSIMIFLSLIWWVFWYSGNIDVPPEELEDDVGMVKLKNQKGISKVVRRMSDRLSNGIRNSFRRNGRANKDSPMEPQSLDTVGDDKASTPAQQQTPDMALSVICQNTPQQASSKEYVRETLSI